MLLSDTSDCKGRSMDASRLTLTVPEVARAFGLSPGKVRAMLRAGKFPICPLPIQADKMLFSRSAIEAFLNQQPAPVDTSRRAR
jgi:hypothetical protein